MVNGVYTKGGKYKKRGLSIVQKTGTEWSQLEKLKIPSLGRKDKGLVSTTSINGDGNILILSYSSSWLSPHTNKIRYSTKKENGKWKKPKVIKNNKLSKKFESIGSPFLSDDGTELYFSGSEKKAGSRYSNDIYKITRSDDSFENWSKPERLERTINTNAWENYYKLFDEDVWAMFSTEEFGDDADILIVKLFEPRPYVDLKGIVKLDNKPMTEDYEIVINGQVVDSVRINKDSSSYAVQLPLGEKYIVNAKGFEMEAKLEVIDATYELEYLPLERDLELSLLPFLDLAGTVTVDGDVIKEPFTVLINGLEVDSLTADESTGTFAVRLPLGGKYELEARSGNYIATKSFVDVSSEASQVRIEKELKLNAIPYVDIGGEFLDAKTDQSIPRLAFPKLMLNGVVVDSVSTENGRYNIRLPWGVKYNLSVQAMDYDPDVTTIDLTFTKNYKLITNNLYATPLENYATITGQVINKKTDLPIRGDFFVEVDGVKNNTGKTTSGVSSYEVRVSLGKIIVLTADAENFFPISETVDLSDETEKVKVIKDLYLVPLEVGEKILLKNIFFETSSTNLKSESFADIDRAIEVLRIRPTLKIEIGGHTDSTGKDPYNLSLSEARAKSVAEYILARPRGHERLQAIPVLLAFSVLDPLHADWWL